MKTDTSLLAQYIPEVAVQPILEWLHQNKIQLKISRARSSKLGDFRVANNGGFPRISVNNNLNPYAFLLTLVHEMAHAEVWQKKSRFKRIQPHGQEWQTTFTQMMQGYLNTDIFPEKLLPAMKKYFQKPKASSVSDPHLMLALKVYDLPSENPQLNEFIVGERFEFRKTPYVVMKKLRTRFQCRNLNNKRIYLIHGLAEVERLAD